MKTILMSDPGMASYGFMAGSAPGGRHYYSADRFAAFYREYLTRDWSGRVEEVPVSPPASRAELERFHTGEYLDGIARVAALGTGSFDEGATPVEPGIAGAAGRVVGCVLHAARLLDMGLSTTAFVPVAGFHHAGPELCRDYCIYNDPGVVLSSWLADAPQTRIAYVDIDVHFGNGVFDRFRNDPRVMLIDMHQDARTFWYSEGSEDEPGTLDQESCRTTALEAGTADATYLEFWHGHAAALEEFAPQKILLVAGADMLESDGLGGFACGVRALKQVVSDVAAIVGRKAGSQLLVLGGGGYALENLGPAWCGVLEVLAGVADSRVERE